MNSPCPYGLGYQIVLNVYLPLQPLNDMILDVSKADTTSQRSAECPTFKGRDMLLKLLWMTPKTTLEQWR